jgi:hypothetical protein
MRSKLCFFIVLILLLAILPGCYNAGMFASANITSVSLEAPKTAYFLYFFDAVKQRIQLL